VAEVQAGAKQRAAQRAVDRDDPFANEQKRLAAEKKRQEEEEKRKREEGKARLKAKMDAMKLA
jgi:membrane protein involved in colicin uptake